MATKQEEIRERLTHLLWTVAKAERNISIDDEVTEFITYLHSEGCALKVEKELPPVSFNLTGNITSSAVSNIGRAYRDAYAGWEATEPLIEEKK